MRPMMQNMRDKEKEKVAKKSKSNTKTKNQKNPKQDQASYTSYTSYSRNNVIGQESHQQHVIVYSCINCSKFETASWQEYEKHTATRHPNKAGWPDRNGRSPPPDRNGRTTK